MGRPRRDLRVRFEELVDRAAGQGPGGTCHEWQGSRVAQGYGRIGIGDGHYKRAHRVAWFLETGSWPTAQILHSCDNPPCVRIDHLREGTAADNIRDMDARGRRGLKKLTRADVERIRTGGEPINDLARELGVARSTVRNHRTPRQRQIAQFEAEEARCTAKREALARCDKEGHLFAEGDCCVRCGAPPHPDFYDPFDIPF